MQVVKPAVPLRLQVKSLRHLPKQERETQARLEAKAEARQPFDLGRGPLLRATLLELEPDERVLLFTMHHIVGRLVDGSYHPRGHDPLRRILLGTSLSPPGTSHPVCRLCHLAA